MTPLPRRSYVLHVGAPVPAFGPNSIETGVRPRTYCGRPADDVARWASPELVFNPAGFCEHLPRCGACLRSSVVRDYLQAAEGVFV